MYGEFRINVVRFAHFVLVIVVRFFSLHSQSYRQLSVIHCEKQSQINDEK